MHISMIVKVMAVVGGAIFIPLAHAADDAAVPGSLASIDFGVALCQEASNATVDPGVRAAVIRAIRPAADGKKVGFRRISCAEVAPDASCFAQEKVLLCRESVIERILRSAAWIAGRNDVEKLKYDDFRLRETEWVSRAILYADGISKSVDIDEQDQRLRAAYGRYQEASDGDAGTAFSAKELIYFAVVDYTLAALLGHELTHVFAESCPIKEQSRVEKQGAFSALTRVQLSGELFCKRSADVNEVRADACGLRHISKVSAAYQRRGADPATMSSARRFAADLITFNLTFGWRPREGAPKGKYPFLDFKQYFYPALRSLAFAAEVAPAEAGDVAVCGEAASLVTKSTQDSSKACSGGGGIVPDDFLALLPKAVERAWNGEEKWTARTVACTEQAEARP